MGKTGQVGTVYPYQTTLKSMRTRALKPVYWQCSCCLRWIGVQQGYRIHGWQRLPTKTEAWGKRSERPWEDSLRALVERAV